jgi:hypothetical protein
MRDDEEKHPEEEIPRQGVLSAIPKRSVYRVLVLLAALAGIIYLRQRTGSIASCMSDAFHVLPPATPGAPAMRVRVQLPSDTVEKKPQ